jgi:predicted transcriptional regulator
VSAGVINTLRDFVPIRPLTRTEALSIAERQAQRFLELHGVTTPPLDEQLIEGLPRIDVKRLSPWAYSGSTEWSRGRWLIVLNGAEPRTRQRFSLAHELKHVVDHVYARQLYGAVEPAARQAWIEQVCDYFAGCLLVPRPMLKRVWSMQTQDLASLAARFRVSQQAMKTRLSQVGLVPAGPRCAPPRRSGSDRDVTYHRLAPVSAGVTPA